MQAQAAMRKVVEDVKLGSGSKDVGCCFKSVVARSTTAHLLMSSEQA
jgi:hypothetical protein